MDVDWKPNVRLDGVTGDSNGGRPVGFHKHSTEKQMFLLTKAPSFVSITDTEPQKLFSAGRSWSTCPGTSQTTLGAHSLETHTEGRNAVVGLCFLEARKATAETGTIYISILTVD